MTLDGVTAPPVEPADPTWYLVLDLAGTWLGAIGTLAATAVAVALAVRAARDQRAQREEQQRVQAERVVLLRVTSVQKPYLLVRNESDQTINTVRVYVVGAPIPTDIAKLPGPHEVLRSGQEKRWPLSGASLQRNVAAVEFDDALGRTWVRTAEGDLHRTHRLPGVNTSVKVEGGFRGSERIVTSMALHTQPGGKLLGLFPEPSQWAWGKYAQARWLGGDPLAHLKDTERDQMMAAENAAIDAVKQLLAVTGSLPDLPMRDPRVEHYELENGRLNVRAYVRDLEKFTEVVHHARREAAPNTK